MLIVLEGLDGAGKSTQVRKLKEYLESKGALDYIHFPRYDAPVYGELISAFLRGDFGTNETVHPQLVALIYAEDRHGAVPQIRKSLDAGRNVLFDRYVYSNIAYQCAKLSDPAKIEELRRWIIDTEFGSFGEPRPDLNIFLDVPLSFVENNLTHSREGDDRNYLQGSKDIHESSMAFQSRVRDMYLMQAQKDPALKVVDCSDADGHMLPEDDIFAKIKALVDERI
ncbi:MAG: dTMP kinase [Bacteroidales bacterium]|nr:dTMP kinase [Bacteroidales bacterium]